ncbi:ER membrane protein DP1/Yop1 [Gaertneriomyces sp. JEL0708]|nr:ER membrane protein DP1/Yop1 [Gaertneriomyces sp. JEL0708]
MASLLNAQARADLSKRLQDLDKSLSTAPVLPVLSTHLQIPLTPLFFLVTLGTFLFILVTNNFLPCLITDLCGYLYPIYASLKASTASSPGDLSTWIGYWAIIGYLHLLEYFAPYILPIFPFYYTFKLVLIIWLVLPRTNGAKVVHDRVMKPLIPVIESLVFLPKEDGDAEKKKKDGDGEEKPQVAPAAEEGTKDKKTEEEEPKPRKVPQGKVKWGYVKLQ